MRNFAAIFLMSIAYALLLGHSIVPHHHHELSDEIGIAHSHGDHHSHSDAKHSHEHGESESEDSDLGFGHLVIHFFHAADGVSIHTAQVISKTFTGKTIFLPAYSTTLAQLLVIPDDPLIHKEDHPDIIYFSPRLFVSGLRAPPVFHV